jgi:hypothetical protein
LPLADQRRVEVVIHAPLGASGASVPAKQEALARLCALQLPVGAWNDMEEEIIRGAAE